MPNKNNLPSKLSAIGVHNTKELANREVYRDAEYYRIQISKFANKALEYHLDIVETKYMLEGHIIYIGPSIDNSLDGNLSGSSGRKRPFQKNNNKEGVDLSENVMIEDPQQEEELSMQKRKHVYKEIHTP